MPREWTYKTLSERSSARLETRKPDTMINAQGYSVRFHVPHPKTPAIERFKVMIDHVDTGYELGECHVFRGSFRFRTDADRVISPQRFILEETGEITASDRCRIVSLCKTPNCCRLPHLEWRILGKKRDNEE